MASTSDVAPPVREASKLISAPRIQAEHGCVVEPRSLPEVLAMIERSDSPEATPIADLIPAPTSSLPFGEPLSAEARAGIAETLEQFVACVNAGDLPRAMALFSDRYLVGHRAGLGIDVEHPEAALTPTPLAEDLRVSIVVIEGGRLLADGRAGVVVRLDLPLVELPAEVAFYTFVRNDGRWLIDSITPVQQDTPAAYEVWRPVAGDGYFDPATGTFTNLMINGEA